VKCNPTKNNLPHYQQVKNISAKTLAFCFCLLYLCTVTKKTQNEMEITFFSEDALMPLVLLAPETKNRHGKILAAMAAQKGQPNGPGRYVSWEVKAFGPGQGKHIVWVQSVPGAFNRFLAEGAGVLEINEAALLERWQNDGSPLVWRLK
jgi:hypothetical protein